MDRGSRDGGRIKRRWRAARVDPWRYAKEAANSKAVRRRLLNSNLTIAYQAAIRSSIQTPSSGGLARCGSAANANTSTIKSDQNRVEAAQEVEKADAKASSVDFVT
jgi:hypothetical protein